MENPLNSAVIERLCQKTTNLQELRFSHMRYNLSEAVRESFADLAAQIIATSACLTKINLKENSFSGPSTRVLLTALSTSPSIQTIIAVRFEDSANLEEEESCMALTDFLAAATNMFIFWIQRHEGRKISI